MDSTSMRQKLLKVGESAKTAESIDRISTLPDSVLFHILSFLPTKYAVGTSILSTRWRYLFASIPCLDFDDSLYFSPRKANENPTREINSFMNFVERVLLLRNVARIDRFHLKCGSDVDASRVDAWICAAVWHNVQELDLCIFTREFTILPCCLFTCKTLVVFKIVATYFLKVPIKVCLPNLKILHLEGIEFLDDNSIQRLISSCPVLEYLVIQSCGWKNIRIFNISSPSLKRLTLNCLPMGLRYSSEIFRYKIVVNAPNLQYLNYIVDFVPEGFWGENLESLVEAHIDVGFSGQQLEYNNDHYVEALNEFLEEISDVQILHISDIFLEAIGLYYDTLPTFLKLKKLVLVNTYIGLRNMPYLQVLLHSSPRLETLACEKGLLHEECDDIQCMWGVPTCVLLFLKTIEIKSFIGHDDELKIVNYFLKYARNLEKMIIHTCGMTEKEESKLFKKLLMLPRASNACQVAIL